MYVLEKTFLSSETILFIIEQEHKGTGLYRMSGKTQVLLFVNNTEQI